jgi:hypothetical protein
LAVVDLVEQVMVLAQTPEQGGQIHLYLDLELQLLFQ